MTQHVPHVNHRFSSIDINRFGLWLFLVSDASFFLALLSARFFVVGTSRPDGINQALRPGTDSSAAVEQSFGLQGRKLRLNTATGTAQCACCC